MLTFPVNMQELYFETRIPQILLTSGRGRRSNIAFTTQILQMCCRKRNIFMQKNLFQRNKAKKEPKGRKNF